MAIKHYKTKKQKSKQQPKSRRDGGFTLVELAIVIVIIGFIIAGITAGASLVKQAQLRSVITDFNNYQVAYNSFLGRYVAVPGDFNRAFAYWADTTGGSQSCGDTATNCNGDGNGLIDYSQNEGRKAWRHLVVAGVISANVPYVTAATVGTIIVGVQTPISKVSGAGYIMAGYDSSSNAYAFNLMASPWAGTGKNSVWLGKADVAAGDTKKGLSKGALSPDDAFIIDQKADDGAVIDVSNTVTAFNGAGTGVVRVMNDPTITTNPCSTTSSGSTVYNAGNSAAVQQTSCVLGFQLN